MTFLMTIRTFKSDRELRNWLGIGALTMNTHIENEDGRFTEIGEPTLIPDQPIRTPDQDYLGHRDFASGLAGQLKSYRDTRRGSNSP